MKILILTEGGNNLGFGHITRCLSLYQIFEEKGIIPEFMLNSNDSRVLDFLEDKHYRMFNWIDEKIKLFDLITNPDIVIIDSYLADIHFYKDIAEIAKISVYIDDTRRLNYPKGVVINGGIYAEELNYPKSDEVTYLLGTQYISLRRPFWEVPEKKIKQMIENAMITFGGDDIRNLTPKILKFLNKKYPSLIKNVIIGKGFQNISEIENAKDKKTNLIYYPNAENIKQLMLESDIAISAGGQTLYEFARIGVPVIAIGVAENQSDNIKGWQKVGFIKYAGWWDDSNVFGNVLSHIEKTKDKNLRVDISLLGKRLVDGKGSERIVNAILY